MALTEIPSELSSTPSIVDGGNATAITIDSSERVGIGRTPNANGVLQLNVATGNNCNITLSENATEKFLIGSITGSNALRIYDFTNSAERMRIDGATGNVGFGGSTPLSKMHIFGNGSVRNNFQAALIVDGGVSVANPYTGHGTGIDFKGRDYSNAVRNYAAINAIMVGNNSHSTTAGDAGFSSALTFTTNGGGASGTNPTERVRILPTGGITFNGDTAAANALGDYEQGSFTAAIPGMGITTNRGSYTKIGRLVKVDFSLTVTSIGTSTSAVAINGIPFISSTNTDSESAGSLMLLNFTADTNTVGINTYVYSRSGGVYMYQTQSNNSHWITVKANDFVVGSAIIGSIVYQTH